MYKLIFFLLFSFIPLCAVQEQLSVAYHLDEENLTIKSVVADADRYFSDPLSSHAKFDADVTLWLQLTLVNETPHPLERVVKFLDIRLDSMEVYDSEGRLIESAGDRLPFVNRRYKDAQIAIMLQAEAKSTVIRYVRFHNADRSDLSYMVMSRADYEEGLSFKKSMHAFFFGGMVVMLFYNIVLYLFVRQKAFLIYILYHSVLLVVMLYYNGLVSQYYRPQEYDVNGGNVPWFLTYTTVILAIAFLRSFLDIEKETPKIDRVLRYFIYSIIVFVPFQYFGLFPNQTIIVIMMPLSLFLLYVSAYYTFVRRNMLAFFYLLGWVTMLVAIVITSLLSLGLVVRNDFTADIFQIGTLVEVTLLSMGLAYRYKLNQDQLIRQNRVIHEQAKLASMGEMITHISHQWRQPLATINSVSMRIDAEHRQGLLTRDLLDRDLEEIEGLTAYMSKTIQDFNSYFTADKIKNSCDLSAIVERAHALVESTLEHHQIDFSIEAADQEEVWVYDGELTQVLLVLFNNAIDALLMREGQKRVITVKIVKENVHHIISVEDNAGGIAPEHLAKVFEPYFTTKFEAQGTGIGLYMSKMIIEESMKGHLSVSNTEQGACFVIMLTA